MLLFVQHSLVGGKLHPVAHIVTRHPDGQRHRTAVNVESPDLEGDARLLLSSQERSSVESALAGLVASHEVYVLPTEE
jgi:hypothetical protein